MIVNAANASKNNWMVLLIESNLDNKIAAKNTNNMSKRKDERDIQIRKIKLNAHTLKN